MTFRIFALLETKNIRSPALDSVGGGIEYSDFVPCRSVRLSQKE